LPLPNNVLLHERRYRRVWLAARWLAEYSQQGFIYDMNTPYEAESMAILQETWAKMALGDATPQETLAEAEQRVNELLANPPTD